MSLNFFEPAVAYAQTANTAATGKTFAQIVDTSIAPLGDLIVSLLYGVAFLVFLYGIMKYFLAGNNEENRSKGKQLALWGVIGLAVLFGVWGIVKVLLSLLTSWQ